ncbi:hypothetical protein IV417_11020 [Alphaproteobacteria bacterium KMM 3653]|uniref:Uncharacterized protein n=1 Tax=Harenicola maris TaxID=2841044 RepID=A0AAP2CPW2_9RHOB|nr:hypothetical protein [Harenicola maris]
MKKYLGSGDFPGGEDKVLKRLKPDPDGKVTTERIIAGRFQLEGACRGVGAKPVFRALAVLKIMQHHP